MTQLPDPSAPFRFGSRGSPLALAQAHETRTRLMAAFDLPEAAFEIQVIKTTGDDRTLLAADRPLKEIGNKGLFTKEIEEAMLRGDIDIAVHSSKALPTVQPDGLIVDCFLPREDVRDAFISLTGATLSTLKEGSVVGTSSLRRRAQLLNRRPDLKIIEFRGNVQTRLAKLEEGVADGTFLAMAGLNRLGMGDVGAKAIETNEMLPAVAQGAIGIERRISDDRAAEMLAALHDKPTGQRLAAERAFLATLDGSCETPIAALATLSDGRVTLQGEVLRTDGSKCIAGSRNGFAHEGDEIGRALAEALLSEAGNGFFDWR